MDITQHFTQMNDAATQTTLHGSGSYTDNRRGLSVGHPVDSDQREYLTLVIAQFLNGLKDASELQVPARMARMGSVLNGSNPPCFQRDRGRATVEAACHVIEFPSHVLIRQGKKLPNGSRPDFPHRFNQTLDDTAEKLIGFQVRWSLGEPRVISVKQGLAEGAQTRDGSRKERSDDWFGGLVVFGSGKIVEITLNDDRRGALVHARASIPESCGRRERL
jgi:hypothetical protein